MKRYSAVRGLLDVDTPTLKTKNTRCEQVEWLSIFQSSISNMLWVPKGRVETTDLYGLYPHLHDSSFSLGSEKQLSVLVRRSADRSRPDPRHFVLSGAMEEPSLRPDTARVVKKPNHPNRTNALSAGRDRSMVTFPVKAL